MQSNESDTSDTVPAPAPQPVESVEFVANPSDSRCKYWCKVIHNGQMLPLPHVIDGANDVPGPYLRQGDDVEIFYGDYVLTGEQTHHRKQRGWTYVLYRFVAAKPASVDAEGKEKPAEPARYGWIEFGKPVKDACRAAGHRELLGGSGDVAAMVRTIHARREGIWPVKKTT